MLTHQLLDPETPASIPPGLCALGIMTKAPQAGKVKTRLTPPLTPEEAAQLNTCFLHDIGDSIAQTCEQAPARGVAVYTPMGKESAYNEILPANFFLVPQRGQDFGERLILAANDLFKVGFQSVCLINSDSPTVPAASFTAAARELAKGGDRVVLGPSDDGGYYLIGLNRLRRRLFEDIEWSTERVLEQTLQRAAEIKMPVCQLPSGFDVDDSFTLQRLCQEILGKGSRSHQVAPKTREFLAGIVEREGRDRIWPKL
jgi:rSAM/selenodomain-associated transferase 1